MNKYDAFKQYTKSFLSTNYSCGLKEPEINTDLPQLLEEFEIAWESGEFDEEPKGECCK